ncbi:meprin A subunit beta [Fundulus heteroclitus]|uniref:meprin A subunit beta n=1 Tax=Fundulus heteroclitus TaxID=8078 RepID=UPI00165A6193|nr:meprin A subunit beta [Fundulus heteroclitus]
MRAFDQFRVKSCIDFKPRDSEDYYLKIQKLNGCWSYIGRVFANGQDLSIGAGCEYIGIVEHEILHALGFYHEQSRFDRDNYVQIVYANIMTDKEHNFRKVASNESTVHGTPYDYMSVMHYGKDAFTNGDGSTIITIDPKFQDVIGQRLEMSPTDAKELNLLYSCNETVAFKIFCGFSNGTMCNMNRCSTNGSDWEVVTDIDGDPSSDHTNLPSGSGDNAQQKGHFIHASTASGQEGDSAKLETEVVKLNRGCNVQCLQFYNFHSGAESDELNIWIREFEDEQDTTGTPRLMGQITGSPTSHWKLHHVSLNATKPFQVVFEARKGAGSSTGGFSVDDINLSETECPHVFIQIDDLENRLNTSSFGIIYSPRQYSKDGYAYRVAVILFKTYVGMAVQLLSGEFDDQLQWPCLQRQMIFQLLDQTPNQQLQMSKQQTFISASGSSIWDNPRESGNGVFYENDELVYGGSLIGRSPFTTLEELQTREFLKGGSAIFMFNFEDLTPLINGTSLPCPQLRPVSITNPPPNLDETPCSARVSPPTSPPSTTPVYRTPSNTHQPPTTYNRTYSTFHQPPTTDNRTYSTVHQPPTTDNRTYSTVHQPPTTDNRTYSTVHQPPTTDNRTYSTVHQPPTTDNRTYSTVHQPPTTDNRTYSTVHQPPTTDNRTYSTFHQPPTTDNRTYSTVHQPPTTDNRTYSTVHQPPTTDNRTYSTVHQPPTTDNRTYSTVHQPPTTDNRTSSTTHPTPTTDNRISTTTMPPPSTTTDDSIFCFCPGMMASPIITVLLASILLLQ